VLDDIRLAGLAPIALFDFSRNGSFVSLIGKGERSAIFWLDSAGHTLPLQAAPVYYASPRFSPDGRRLAFAMGTPRQLDIWIKDLDANTTPLRLTRMSGSNHHPVWTPDGTSLVFESVLGESQSLYWISADGASDAQRLTDDKIRRVPFSFSPDGKRLAFSQEGGGGGGQSEIWTAPVESGSDRVRLGKPELFLRNIFGGSSSFSPDGSWMAYSTDETGRLEVYVSPFPGPGRKWPISSGGGSRPVWSSNGRELFFLTPEDRIMVVSYTAKGNAFAADKPRLWSEKRLLRLPTIGHDVAPDGKRFAAILNADGTAEPIAPQLIVLLNFFDELRRRVPVSH